MRATRHRMAADPRPVPSYVVVLHDATAALDRAEVPHVVFGSIATRALGRPRDTGIDEDIDLFIRPPDAASAGQALSAGGFQVKETDPTWLNRATRDGVTVDLIFRTAAEIHLDREMLERAVPHQVGDARIRLIPPEDYAVMKAVLHDEPRAYDWFDALSLVSRPDLDWDYLIRRALRHGAQRILSLLVYARSSGIAVSDGALAELTAAVDR